MKNFFRTLISIAGFAIGPGVVVAIYSLFKTYFDIDFEVLLEGWAQISIYIISAIISGIIFIILSKRIVDFYISVTTHFEDGVEHMPLRSFFMALAGILVGIILAFFMSWLLDKIPLKVVTIPVSIILFIMLAYAGARIGKKCADKYVRSKKSSTDEECTVCGKILDTSVIIDGRIFDILKTGIIDGGVILPEFVLSELRHIADSQDTLKRTKGRRGLDILKKIQTELDIPVQICDTDYEDLTEVDAKLLRLGRELGATVITNDFNLNKVASVQGVKVFNINELANAVKPMLLPGEELTVTVVKEGREYGQGVAFLDDGTMIVVESASHRMNETLDVIVTSALQTAAGRMVFARIKD